MYHTFSMEIILVEVADIICSHASNFMFIDLSQELGLASFHGHFRQNVLCLVYWTRARGAQSSMVGHQHLC